jgi:hypothetical protein
MVGSAVTAITSRPVEAATAAPADYGQMAELYGDDIRRVVSRMLGPSLQQHVDDTVQYVYSKIHPGGNRSGTGVIEQYNPAVRSSYTGTPVSFRAFLLNKVNLYSRGRRESLSTHYGRERLTADAPVGGGSSWIELYGPGQWDDYEALDDEEFLDRMRDCLSSLDEEEGSPPLAGLFDLLAAETAVGHIPTQAQVSKKLGISAEAAGDYIGRLQGALSALPTAVRYEAGGLQLTAAEMRSAAEALRATPGHHVMPAFELARSRLMHCGKKWYVKVARTEMRLYPAARIARGTPDKRTSPVKFALQHWFDRQCPPLPVPEPAAEPLPSIDPDDGQETALELLEAALWRLPGADAVKVDLVLATAGPAVSEAVRAAFGEGS